MLARQLSWVTAFCLSFCFLGARCDAGANGFGAVAADMEDYSDETVVSAGTAVSSSRLEADQQAIKQCEAVDGINCKIVRRFSNGECGYISVGRQDSGVCWGAASTRAEAFDQCRQKGCSCKSPIGSCTSEIATSVDSDPPSEATKGRPSGLGNWFVIAGTWPSTESTKLKARLALLSSNGIEAQIINTDDYPNFTPGLRAVVLGPTSREEATTRLDTVQTIVPDAFIKKGF